MGQNPVKPEQRGLGPLAVSELAKEGLRERLEEIVGWSGPVSEADLCWNVVEPQPWNGGTKVYVEARGRKHWLFVHRWPDRHEDFDAETVRRINEERAKSLDVNEVINLLPQLLSELRKQEELAKKFRRLAAEATSAEAKLIQRSRMSIPEIAGRAHRESLFEAGKTQAFTQAAEMLEEKLTPKLSERTSLCYNCHEGYCCAGADPRCNCACVGQD